MSEGKRKIIIVGCPRSGTSLFADLLMQSGLKTITDFRSSDQYPRGYHEYFPLLLFHKAVERYPRGGSHRITDESFLQEDLLNDEFTKQMFQTAFKPFWNPEIDFIKYPQFALSFEFLLNQFPDIHFIVLWRNPIAVFKSLVQKEFPIEMRPASGIKAILLQSVYAEHILNAYCNHPEKVSVLLIDSLINQNYDLSPFLRELGFDVKGENRISRTIQPKIWTKNVPLPWYLYYQAMRLSLKIGSGFLPTQMRKFTNIDLYNREILKISHGPHIPDN